MKTLLFRKKATTVVLVSGGYPEDYEKNKVVSGLEQVTNSQVFHSGTKFNNEEVVTNGGRVFAIVFAINDLPLPVGALTITNLLPSANA